MTVDYGIKRTCQWAKDGCQCGRQRTNKWCITVY